MDASEGSILTEVTLLAFDGAPVTDGGFVPLVGSEELVGAVEPVRLAEPVGSVEKAVPVDWTALANEPVPTPHPEPQKAKVISKMKKRKNGKLCS